MVVCKVEQCSYHSVNDFCLNKFIFMTPQGFCGRIYDATGRVKMDWNTPVTREKEEDEKSLDSNDNNNVSSDNN